MHPGDFSSIVAARPEVVAMCGDIRKVLGSTEVRAMQFREQYLRFSHLWTKQPSAALQVCICDYTGNCAIRHLHKGSVLSILLLAIAFMADSLTSSPLICNIPATWVQ